MSVRCEMRITRPRRLPSFHPCIGPVLVASVLATLFGQPVGAQGVANLSDALRSAEYRVYVADVNGDGESDLLLKAKLRIAMIPLDDLAIPIPLRPTSPTFVLLSSGSGYFLNSAPASSLVSNAAWQPADYELVFGDFVGNGTSGMLLRARGMGLASFTISTQVETGPPLLVQAITSQSIGVDLGAQDVTIELADQNNDGRADLVVRRLGAVSTVLLADANGRFLAGDANDVQAAWFGMLASLSDGNVSAALEYVAPGMRAQYQEALSAMGSSMTHVRGTLSNLAPVHIGGGTATFAVDQTTGGAIRMHLIEFTQVDGRWMLSSF